MWIVKALFLAIALSLLAFGGLSLYGLSLPEAHHASVSVDLKASQAQLWDLLTAYEDYPLWWSQVKSVKMAKTAAGQAITFNEDERGTRVGFITLESKRPKKLVREVYDPIAKLGWSGTWTFTLERVGKGKKALTRLTLAEDGSVSNPFFRVLASKVFGYQRQLTSFTSALSAEIGRQANQK